MCSPTSFPNVFSILNFNQLTNFGNVVISILKVNKTQVSLGTGNKHKCQPENSRIEFNHPHFSGGVAWGSAWGG